MREGNGGGGEVRQPLIPCPFQGVPPSPVSGPVRSLVQVLPVRGHPIRTMGGTPQTGQGVLPLVVTQEDFFLFPFFWGGGSNCVFK